MTGFSGRCLCGAVSFDSSADPVLAGHCHCTDCRKSSGTGHCTHVVVPKAAVTVAGEVTVYESAADSGHTVGRAFCPTCGSPVFSVNSSMPEMIFPRASALDDPEVIAPSMVVYTSRAPSWDLVDPKLMAFPAEAPGSPKQVIADHS